MSLYYLNVPILLHNVVSHLIFRLQLYYYLFNLLILDVMKCCKKFNIFPLLALKRFQNLILLIFHFYIFQFHVRPLLHVIATHQMKRRKKSMTSMAVQYPVHVYLNVVWPHVCVQRDIIRMRQPLIQKDARFVNVFRMSAQSTGHVDVIH